MGIFNLNVCIFENFIRNYDIDILSTFLSLPPPQLDVHFAIPQTLDLFLNKYIWETQLIKAQGQIVGFNLKI